MFYRDAHNDPFCLGPNVSRFSLCARPCLHGTRLTLVHRVPNLPFFYLVYRAWSHWRAIAGGKHIKWLVEKNLLQPTPSSTLDKLYSQSPKIVAGKEQLLLTQQQVASFSESLDVPALEIELERAIWQVEQALHKEEQAGKDSQGKDDTKTNDAKSKDVNEKQ